ncbi:VTT domain-containing protein [Chloroflexota bacterium]
MPLPYLVVTFTLGSVSNPALVGVASGLGAGIGGTLVYLFGRGGRTLLFGLFSSKTDETSSTKVSKFLDLAHRRGSVVIFLMSAMLNPAFAPMAIALGALRFSLGKFFLWCCAGNIVKSLVIAYCGHWGLGKLLHWLGWF